MQGRSRRSRKAGEEARRRAEVEQEREESMLGGEAMAAVGGD